MIKNIKDMTDQEAHDYLSNANSSAIMKMHSADEINLLISKANKIKVSQKQEKKNKEQPKSLDINNNKNLNNNIINNVSPTIPPQKYPGLLQTAKNFGSAMYESAKTGFKFVSDDIFKKRMAICTGCEHWVTSPIQRCKICNCTTAKQRLASSYCPLKPPKWGRE